MDLAGIEEAVRLAEQRWPGLEFNITGSEAHSSCPFEGVGDDRFMVNDIGHYFCRQCGVSGWIDDDRPRQLTLEEQNALEIRRLERQARERDKRLTALERMHRCQDHLTYHKLMDPDDRAYWHSQGMTDETIDRYLLGVCWACPCDKEHRPSYTIPVINGGKLVNIRHRLVGVEHGSRYRPHTAGLGNTLFDADHLYTGQSQVMIVEGEKKSIVVGQYGFNTVGIMGKAAFPPAWAVRFEPFERVDVCLDPDAMERAEKITTLFGDAGRIVVLPVKPDDFFVMGGTPQEFRDFVRWGRRVD